MQFSLKKIYQKYSFSRGLIKIWLKYFVLVVVCEP